MTRTKKHSRYPNNVERQDKPHGSTHSRQPSICFTHKDVVFWKTQTFKLLLTHGKRNTQRESRCAPQIMHHFIIFSFPSQELITEGTLTIPREAKRCKIYATIDDDKQTTSNSPQCAVLYTSLVIFDMHVHMVEIVMDV